MSTDGSPKSTGFPGGEAHKHYVERVGRITVLAACVFVFFDAGLVLVGWATANFRLIHYPITNTYGTMMPLTAASLLLAATALWLLRPGIQPSRRQRVLAVALATLPVVVGGLVLLEYMMYADFGMDHWLFPQTAAAFVKVLPGRPAISTSFCLVAIGLALIFIDARAGRRALEIMLWFGIALAAERGISYLYGEGGLEGPTWKLFGELVLQPMAPKTAAALIALMTGVLLARPQRLQGLVGLFLSPGPPHMVARWLVPAAILAPVLFGWLGLLAWRARPGSTTYPISIVVVSMIALLITVLSFNVRAIHKADIKRVSAERELAERARFERAVLDNAGAGVLAVDPLGKTVTSNAKLQGMMGFSAAELAGMPLSSLVHPQERVQNQRRFDGLIAGERTSYFLETRCTRKDGTTFWAELNTSVALDHAGKPEFVICIIEDVSERKEAERAQRRLIAILEATPDFVGIADPNGKAIYVNRAGRALTGHAPEELPRLSIADFHTPAAAQRVLKDGVPAAVQTGMWTGETQLKAPDGKAIPVSQVILAHKEPDGGVAYLSTIMRDISFRKRAEEAQRFLADVSRVASGSLEIDTILRSVTRLVVPAYADACSIYLCAPEGSISKAASAGISADGARIREAFRLYPAAKKRNALVEQVVRTGTPVIVPVIGDEFYQSTLRVSRHHAWFRRLRSRSLLAVPVRARSGVVGAICYVMTESGRRYGPHQLVVAEETAARVALALDNAELLKQARDATRVRDEVLRVVAHDLRNPLNTISLATDFLRELHVAPGTDAWSEKLDIVTRAVGQADTLIQDLLDAARMQAGKLALELRPTDVNTLAAEAIQMHQQIAEEHGVALRSTVPGELGCVSADAARLRQVFANLIGNAIKFSPAGTAVELGASKRDGEICFSVRDHGPGIAEADVANLFTPFWQARKAHAGAGLGLSIAKAIVEAHSGGIWVESKPGTGSTFFFTLPAVPPRTGQFAAD